MNFYQTYRRLWAEWTLPRPTVRPSVRLRLEQLEDRLAPAAFTVTTTADNGNNANPTAGSLRAAVIDVNAGNSDTIKFNITDGAGGAQIAQVTTNPLPTIIRPVTIDGTTAPGGKVQIIPNPGAGKAPPSGTNALTFGVGARSDAGGSQVLGLTINGFSGGDGIQVNNVSQVIIGAKIDPTTQQPTYAPVVAYGEQNGIEITGVNATGNKVYDSYLGTDTNSRGGIGNSNAGILIGNAAHGNTIGGKGNALNIISGNTNAGVAIQDANTNTVAGNYIGTNKAGTAAVAAPPPGNVQQAGVFIGGQSTGNMIGLSVGLLKNVPVAPENLISGNFDGVVVTGQNATTNTIKGNWIGIDATGKVAVPNTDVGVALNNTNGNTIGDVGFEFLNVISKNTNGGISVNNNSQNNTIQGNNIGIGPDPGNKNLNLGNGGIGLSFDATSTGNTVRANRIANNTNDAIKNAGQNKVFDPNSIVGNGFGIDDGTEAGAPVLTSAFVSGNTLIVTGTLSSTPNTNFGLEFFGNTVEDPSGFGQGEQWLGTGTVTTDANGNFSFQAMLPAIYGGFVTATATDLSPDGSTSQFSNDVQVAGEAPVAAVGGFVWNDTDGDGLPDPSEAGVPGVNVLLFTSGGTQVAATVTDPNGNYSFTNVAPGDYYLQFISPSGFIFTPPYQGDDTVASHADPTDGTTEVFTLIAGEVNPYLNAGLVPSGGLAAIRSGHTPIHPATHVTARQPSASPALAAASATRSQTPVSSPAPLAYPAAAQASEGDQWSSALDQTFAHLGSQMTLNFADVHVLLRHKAHFGDLTAESVNL